MVQDDPEVFRGTMNFKPASSTAKILAVPSFFGLVALYIYIYRERERDVHSYQIRSSIRNKNFPGDCNEVVPLEKTFSSHPHELLSTGRHPWDELWVCDPLRLVYIHIFKSWGTTLGGTLIGNCKRSFGKDSARVFSGWTGDKSVKDYNLTSICQIYTCFTLYRDPIDRFLSGYHEIMKRRKAHVPKHNATSHLQGFINDVISGKVGDPHVMPQFKFIKTGKSLSSRVSTILYGPVQRAGEVMETLYCGSLSKCRHNVSCNFEFPKGKTRDRFNSDYGIGNFTFTPEGLLDTQILELEKYYHMDYCLFGIQPRLSNHTYLCS